MSTYYDILRVSEDADDKQIKAAYRQAVLAYHPDQIPKGVSKRMRDDAAQTWLEIQEAFSVLSDPAKREEYDALLEEMRQAEEIERQFDPGPPPPAPREPKPSQQSPPKPQPPPAPAPPPSPVKKQSFWGPSNTPFGAIAFLIGAIGCLLLVEAIADTQVPVYPGLTLVSFSLALLCWRHGMRPGTDPKILGGSVFLFIFSAMVFFGWLQSTSTNSNQTNPTASRTTVHPVPLNTTPPKGALATPTMTANKRAQPTATQSPAKNNPTIAATKDSAAGNITFSSGTSATGSGPPTPSKPTGTADLMSWRNPRDGQVYGTRLDGEHLYLYSMNLYPNKSGEIGRCEFHRAISVGLSWAGECWEWNSKDQNTHKSDATIVTLSETRLEMATGDLPKFTMTPADVIANPTSNTAPGPENTVPRSRVGPEKAPPTQKTAAPRPDVAGLSYLERQSIESACSYDKNINGPAAYYSCVENQLGDLARISWRPDFGSLTGLERQSLESACSYDKNINGPAAYYRCLESQFRSLAVAPRPPDLSSLSSLERQSIESACSYDKNINGPAAYYRCVRAQVEQLKKRR